MCASVCISPIISVITCLICLISSHYNTGTTHPSKRATQTTQPNFPSNGKTQNKEGIQLKPGKRRPKVGQVRKNKRKEKTEKYSMSERIRPNIQKTK